MRRSRAAFALRGLDVPVARGAADVDAPTREIDVSPLQAQHLARPHPGHGKNHEVFTVPLSQGYLLCKGKPLSRRTHEWLKLLVIEPDDSS